MSEELQLYVLGTRVDVSITGDAAAEALDSARTAWGELAVGGGARGDAADAADEIVADGPLGFTVPDASATPQFLDSLSSRATLAGIGARSGELLMLHAAGLADPESGTVIACVAPSGTGKTTISTSAAGHLEYVTDETVAVREDGSVVRYPKPLSVKQRGEGWLPKLQREPGSLGLSVAPEAGLRLGGVVLLRRLRDDEFDEGADAAGESQPRLEPVDLFDAMLELVPEMSYLGRMQRPLQRVASALLSTGGAQRLVYREASEAIHVVAAFARAQEDGVRDAWAEPAGGAGGVLAESRLEVERWEAVVAGAGPGACVGADVGVGAGLRDGEGLGGGLRLGAELDDIIVDPERGQALIFSGNTVRLVSNVAAATVLAVRGGVSEGDLRGVLAELFGEPPVDGDPVGEVIATLVDGGVLYAAT